MCLEGNREGRMCLTDAAVFLCSVFTISKVLGSGTQPSRENSCTHAAKWCVRLSALIILKIKHIRVSGLATMRVFMI